MWYKIVIVFLMCVTSINAQHLECCETSGDVLKTLKGFWKKKNSKNDITYHYWIKESLVGMDEIETIETKDTVSYISPSCQPKIGIDAAKSGFSIIYWHHLHADEEVKRIVYLDATTLILISNDLEEVYYKIPNLF